MSDTKKCERCGERDCPTLPIIAICWPSRNLPGENQVNKPEWTAAFHACAAMGTRMEMKALRSDGPMNLARAVVGPVCNCGPYDAGCTHRGAMRR